MTGSRMELWAAIDLMGGSVVTLVQGRETEKAVWEHGAVELAERWQREGADGLHVIDLDAALGRGANDEVIREIIGKARVPVQVGGGIRSGQAVRRWLDGGASRTIIGTMAYNDPAALEGLLRRYGPERIVVAADYKDGEIVSNGWRRGHGITVGEAVRNFSEMGVTNLLTTCVGRDGMRMGPDIETVRSLVSSMKGRVKVVASGGIRDATDLCGLKEAGATGVVIGRALYEGTVKLAEAKRSLVS